MFSSAHHGAKEGLQTYTFWNVWEAFRDYDKQEQARAKRDGTKKRTSVRTHELEIKHFR